MIFYDFAKSPTELVDYLKDKKPELHFDYDEIMHNAHHRAFTVAKITKLDLLSDIQDSLKTAMDEGKPFKQWQEEIKPTLQKKGWWGEVEAINPKTQEVKNIYVGSRRLKNIFDTNMRVAYNRGRYQNQMDSLGEYFYYSAIMDSDTRPGHRKLHGTILKKDHPFWDENYTPNGWRCRCKIRVYTLAELKARGLTPSNIAPPSIAEKDWAYNPGKKDNIKEIYKDKVNNSKGPISKAVKQELKDDLNYLKQNDKLYKNIKNLFAAKNTKKIEISNSDLFGANKKVLLNSNTVQDVANKEITAFEYSLVPEMLKGDKKVFLDNENAFILLKKLGKNYKISLKNITNSNEIELIKLQSVKDYEKEFKNLSTKG